ncbi:MAG: hypothetical protein NTY81_01125 [Candidatus Staskawiczbacteria bacterium]|nr:hypothetical protein [Candidatus Staskawiczbacteria bacterium]
MAETRRSPEEIKEEKLKRFDEAAKPAIFDRLNEYDEKSNHPLWAGNIKEGEEKYEEELKRLFETAVTHGYINEKGEFVEKPGDHDAWGVLKMLELAGLLNKVKFVRPGQASENIPENKNDVMADTGNYQGFGLAEGRLHADHHGENAEAGKCATKIMFEKMVALGRIKIEDFDYTDGEIKRNYLYEYVNFVNDVDNESYNLNSRGLQNFHRSLYGLNKCVKPEDLFDFFKNGGDSRKFLSEGQMKKMGIIQTIKKDRETGKPKKINRSEDVRKNIEESVKILEAKKKNGMIANNEIIVDIGKEMKFGVQVARALGYKGYWNYSPDPEKNSFFLCLVNDGKFPPGFHLKQGAHMVDRNMVVKPIDKNAPLEVKLNDIIAEFFGKDFKATGKLKEYLKQEKEANGKTALPVTGEEAKTAGEEKLEAKKAKASAKTELRDSEVEKAKAQIALHRERATKDIENEYIRKTKLGDIKGSIDDFLKKERVEAEKEFALDFFERNKQEMARKGATESSSEEMKIHAAMAFALQIEKDPRYENLEKRMKKIDVFVMDVKEGQVRPETLFLLLNYMQASIRRQERKIAGLRATGNTTEVEQMERYLEELRLTRASLAGKMLGKDVKQDAEESFAMQTQARRQTKNEAVEYWAGQKNDPNIRNIEDNFRFLKNEELIKSQWIRLSAEQKEAYKKSIGFEGEITQEVFENSLREKGRQGGETFFALLNQNYKPYLLERKKDGKFWEWRKEEKIFIPKVGNNEDSGITEAEYQRIVQEAKEKYNQEIEGKVRGNLGEQWEKYHREQVDKKIEQKINALAVDPLKQQIVNAVIDDLDFEKFMEGKEEKIPTTEQYEMIAVAVLERMYAEARKRLFDEPIKKLPGASKKSSKKLQETPAPGPTEPPVVSESTPVAEPAVESTPQIAEYEPVIMPEEALPVPKKPAEPKIVEEAGRLSKEDEKLYKEAQEFLKTEPKDDLGEILINSLREAMNKDWPEILKQDMFITAMKIYGSERTKQKERDEQLKISHEAVEKAKDELEKTIKNARDGMEKIRKDRQRKLGEFDAKVADIQGKFSRGEINYREAVRGIKNIRKEIK